MKDKLFWIALIIAGIYLFNKMNSSKTTAPTDSRTEQLDDRFDDSPTRPETIEPNFGDKDKPLNLPRRDGEVTYQENTQDDYHQQDRDFPGNQSKVNSGEKDISLGEYGSITLPKKDGGAVSSGGSSSNYDRGSTSTSSSRSSERMLVKLDPQTAIGDGTLNQKQRASYVVFDQKSLQITNSNVLNIYIDSGGFAAMTDCSNSEIYVKANAQLMLTGNGSNNTIYYENGASIRNGLAENRRNQMIEVREIVFE